MPYADSRYDGASAGMKYSGTLALSAPAIDKDKGIAAREALEKLPGIAKVNVFPATHTLTVQFKDNAKLTSTQLIGGCSRSNRVEGNDVLTEGSGMAAVACWRVSSRLYWR